MWYDQSTEKFLEGKMVEASCINIACFFSPISLLAIWNSETLNRIGPISKQKLCFLDFIIVAVGRIQPSFVWSSRGPWWWRRSASGNALGSPGTSRRRSRRYDLRHSFGLHALLLLHLPKARYWGFDLLGNWCGEFNDWRSSDCALGIWNSW